ncbi:GNAT family N-acetyltransferase [Aristaeella hokkaidonensis]|uniref:GNAT family N-acetyltransferase n=1 Tax=Aristaeella hokkaidonensis TaxID=3046382 RepID=A0AC61MVK1_9FIRM|nr:GNAT family N-acetyltransferase [Aristaeella hokkaidonensis]QUC66545.1 GNAT family N-acetyltransferase [Aristaeella hokkaidonensis]SNT94034.1 Ribosomal protein S18 acetylase RimI [Aristaeella hokkaidonensis]
MENEEIKIELYTKEKIPDVVAFEKQLREEEDVWGWEIDDAYIKSVTDSFKDPRFKNALSLLAYLGEQVVGRIDVVRIPSYFDGTVKAYLDWICVLKSARHKGVAQALMKEMRSRLKAEGIDTLIALTASNDEAQRFYKSVPDSSMHDIGIWIDIK